MKLRIYLRRLRMMPYITIFLVTINVILFLICTFTGQMLYNIGGLSPVSFFEDGQYHRILTAMFLHADIQHLVNNMLLLGGLGAMLEPEIGHVGFGILYFISGLGGQAVSLIYKVYKSEWFTVSIGASGAVYGLVGVLLVMALLWTRDMPNVTWQRVLFVVVYSLYSSMQVAGIDNAAHLGGLLTGALGACIMCIGYKFVNKRKQETLVKEDGSKKDEY